MHIRSTSLIGQYSRRIEMIEFFRLDFVKKKIFKCDVMTLLTEIISLRVYTIDQHSCCCLRSYDKIFVLLTMIEASGKKNNRIDKTRKQEKNREQQQQQQSVEDYLFSYAKIFDIFFSIASQWILIFIHLKLEHFSHSHRRKMISYEKNYANNWNIIFLGKHFLNINRSFGFILEKI